MKVTLLLSGLAVAAPIKTLNDLYKDLRHVNELVRGDCIKTRDFTPTTAVSCLKCLSKSLYDRTTDIFEIQSDLDKVESLPSIEEKTAALWIIREKMQKTVDEAEAYDRHWKRENKRREAEELYAATQNARFLYDAYH
jgi:hypothetical protein